MTVRYTLDRPNSVTAHEPWTNAARTNGMRRKLLALCFGGLLGIPAGFANGPVIHLAYSVYARHHLPLSLALCCYLACYSVFFAVAGVHLIAAKWRLWPPAVEVSAGIVSLLWACVPLLLMLLAWT
jgi:hypothetical protein